MKTGIALALVMLASTAAPAWAAGKRATQLWNLTGETLNRVELAPAGSTAWGKNQCANDKDGEVDFDERLPITDIRAGRYDVRIRDTNGRLCIVRDVEVKDGEVFVIHERQLTSCTP